MVDFIKVGTKIDFKISRGEKRRSIDLAGYVFHLVKNCDRSRNKN